MKIKEVIEALERFAPLPLQESYDNAGLQVGLTEVEVSGALLCLDVTEAVLDEAIERGCNLVLSHHPLLFRSLKSVTDRTLVERCLRKAIMGGLAIYSAHTNLDNARGGVNFKIAEKLKLHSVEFLQKQTEESGSGVIGCLEKAVSSAFFLENVKSLFGVECLMHNERLRREVKKVAICGGAGDFLLDDAIEQGADAFITGEMHYHLYFGQEQRIQIAVLGHYQSEQYTKELICSIIQEACPSLQVVETRQNTNPINYL
ncbi:MAG: Nif3-like dinuclear metal center hexameric protein [Bacteroidaceae bacterium]